MTVFDTKNGIARVTDLTLAIVCVYAGCFLHRCERYSNGQLVYVFVDHEGTVAQLEKEFTDDFTVLAKEFSNATRVVWSCQHQLRQQEYKARERD